MKDDPTHMADMEMFHALVDHRDQIHRTVTVRPDGVDTLTESDDPAVVTLIQSHVNAMYGRVKDARPIHVRDPLFRAVFENTDKIVMAHEMTPRGIKVTETSPDPYVVRADQGPCRGREPVPQERPVGDDEESRGAAAAAVVNRADVP